MGHKIKYDNNNIINCAEFFALAEEYIVYMRQIIRIFKEIEEYSPMGWRCLSENVFFILNTKTISNDYLVCFNESFVFPCGDCMTYAVIAVG